ncbi:MAG: hypothetical protein Q4G22_05365 [Paracoccus sp. (in: a-proteobacteria)]|uniref:hypothetical protein n=1 Tax=Paracoccus sp. TaxID=267 RepID=UPI0026DEE8FD|nr:hypothetical protein [Paracoccus sp. (in: a-proteobacteria)]MDO5631251.1 hypothetical protein [Paracoccus sp. (in: a-proteobacteria)]
MAARAQRLPLMVQARRIIAMAMIAAIGAGTAEAQGHPLMLNGQVSPDGAALRLDWPIAPRGMAQVFRRDLGQTGPQTWQPVTQPGTARLLTDSLPTGIAREYQVRITGARPATAVWAAGHQVPAQADQGAALMIVDDTLADDLAAALDLFQSDLTGAGYRVTRHLSPRAADGAADNLGRAMALRRWITAQFRADPDTPHTVILIGHLPIVRTGRVNPDGHGPHAVPTDLFYADPDGFWPPAPGADGTAQLMPGTLPADGIRMQIGRIDFALLDDRFGGELPLLRAYFDRNHRWRHGQSGDPRRAYAGSPHLMVERNAVNNIVGPDAVTTGGHHDTAGGGPFLIGVDFGQWSGGGYHALPPSEATFALNFGSAKHRFDQRNNAMTALLAQPGPLAVGWGGRPAWQLHGMALGESIGQAHLRTVNNGHASRGGLETRDYPANGHYDWLNPPWVNLLGDPTLRPFPLPPVSDARAETTPQGTRLRWTLPDGADGALILRAQGDGPYQALNAGDLATTEFLDPAPPPGAHYLIRANGLAQVHAGSFHRLAQGITVAAP